MRIRPAVITLLINVCVFGAGPVWADEATERATVSAVARTLAPGFEADRVEPSAIPGLYEVSMGAEVVYISADGKHLLLGNLFDLATRENLSDKVRTVARKKLLDSVDEKQIIVFAPETVKHEILVFTDIDCVYCRKMHQGIEDFMKAGIKVSYFLYPRAGEKSGSGEKAISVWCAKDQRAALTDAKGGKDVPKATCGNPVGEHLELGRKLGVSGTPSIFFADGYRYPGGYAPAEKLLPILEERAKK